jgi:Domain of unknown function (DUF4062)
VDEVERAISATGHVIVNMADFPAADQPPARLCTERVQSCEVYVGVLGTRYGTPVPDRPEVSYTELEFDTATKAGLDRLVFLIDTSAANVGIPVTALTDYKFGARQEAFRRRVQDSGLVTRSFASPEELGRLVERSLRELVDVRHCQGGGIERVPPSMQRKSRLDPGDSLAVGQSLYSPDGRSRFTLGHDANMVVYRQGLEDICDTGTANMSEPERLTLEEDGWLILYDVNGKKLWEKGPGGSALKCRTTLTLFFIPPWVILNLYGRPRCLCRRGCWYVGYPRRSDALSRLTHSSSTGLRIMEVQKSDFISRPPT